MKTLWKCPLFSYSVKKRRLKCTFGSDWDRETHEKACKGAPCDIVRTLKSISAIELFKVYPKLQPLSLLRSGKTMIDKEYKKIWKNIINVLTGILWSLRPILEAEGIRTISINLSPIPFQDMRLSESLKKIAQKYNVDFSVFNFEITETALSNTTLVES